ncbi:MAG: DUF1236 domain-containing protein [Rhizobiales bacterium]|nr:DUF1236 domain-containing protein [Hyphomicrobiales bacterium]
MHSGQNKAGVRPAETTGQAPQSPDANSPRASDKSAPGKSMEKEPAAKGSPAKSGASDIKGKANESTTQAPSQPASPRSSQSTTPEKSTTQAPSMGAPKSSQSTTTEQRGTTGQGAAGAAKLSTEQRTKITTVIKQQNMQRVEPSKLNISIRVGARVPTSVRFYPLPVEVVAIYPEWRGYDYILVGDEILVIDPRTHEIVAILEA